MPMAITDVLELLTTQETANRTGLSIHTLLKHRKQKRGLPFVRLGRTVRYRTVDVEQYLISQTVVSAEPTSEPARTAERGWKHPALRGGRHIT